MGIVWNKGKRDKRVDCICITCGSHFEEFKSGIEEGRGKYCSRKCWKSNHSVWNKGLIGFLAGISSPNWKGGLTKCKKCGKELSQRHSKTELCKKCFWKDPEYLKEYADKLKKIDNIGEKNSNWKGNKVSYRNLHRWVERWLGKPHECMKCNKKIGRIEWASISHHAQRELNDYMQLCVTCHRKYDRKARI